MYMNDLYINVEGNKLCPIVRPIRNNEITKKKLKMLIYYAHH